MDQTERNILEHIGRYRLTTRRVLQQLCGDGPHSDSAIARLQQSGMLWSGRSLPRGRAVYQLTAKGTALIDVSEARARPLRSQSLHKHLGILLYCHVEGSRRYRLEDTELREFLGDAVPDSTHCMGIVKGQPVLFSTYVPGQRTKLKSVLRWVREQHDAVREIAVVRKLLTDRRYGLAIVTDTPQRGKAIVSMLHRPERDGRPALARRALILVEAVPEFDALINGAVEPNAKARRQTTQSPVEVDQLLGQVPVSRCPEADGAPSSMNTEVTLFELTAPTMPCQETEP